MAKILIKDETEYAKKYDEIMAWHSADKKPEYFEISSIKFQLKSGEIVDGHYHSNGTISVWNGRAADRTFHWSAVEKWQYHFCPYSTLKRERFKKLTCGLLIVSFVLLFVFLYPR